MSYQHNMLHCRICGHKIDAASRVHGEIDTGPPTDGAFSVCLYCGEVSLYEIGPFGVLLREPTLDELAEFARDYGHLSRLVQEFQIQKGNP